ncbi:NlpC/P60 family protein [Pseudonocardia nantongensis]|uniref:NlpC/P60 family protein n=1 Tax=Pseudonocardia nantongensis TaxID=1181885 RepID=UPI00397E8CD8
MPAIFVRSRPSAPPVRDADAQLAREAPLQRERREHGTRRTARRRPAAPVAAGVLALLAALVVATPGIGTAAPVPASLAVTPAQPPPPPPNPDDDELERSRQGVTDRAAEVGRLTARLAELSAEADHLQIQVAARRESALEARDTADVAGREADTAAARAQQARQRTEEAGRVVADARSRLDAFVGDVYSHGLDLGPLGLLSRATDPQDLMDKARLTDALSRDQEAALDRLERARVEQANTDSLARAAQEEADRRRAAAEQASDDADRALVAASAAADEQQGRLDAVRAEQADVQRRLDAAENSDAGLRAQRERFDAWQAEQERIAEAAAQRARDEARARVAQESGGPDEDQDRDQDQDDDSGSTPRRTGSAAIEQVIDRAMAQIGVTYAWGGGNARGPSKGIRDGGVADDHGDYRKVGFDCSGLMLYAFAGVGIDLPRYSGNQADAGEQVPADEMRRGDMLSWEEDGRTYHIAIYLGDGKMLEAPYSGASVKISSVRYDGLSDTVTRML